MKFRQDIKINGKDVYELEKGDILKQLKKTPKHTIIIWDEATLNKED